VTTAIGFDLDGTVTTEELLPLIAAELGLLAEMTTLTRLTLDGTIDFETSFRLRCAMLRYVPIGRVREVVASAGLSAPIVAFIEANRARAFLVTGNLDVWIAPLVWRLGCRAFSSTGLTEGDRLLDVQHVLRKSEAVHAMRQEFDRIVVVGESVNDVPMFEAADIGVAYGGVHEPVAQVVAVADYVTYDPDALCSLLDTL
jgi:phosphoserine phosphatase